jgi:hypothetical protein
MGQSCAGGWHQRKLMQPAAWPLVAREAAAAPVAGWLSNRATATVL